MIRDEGLTVSSQDLEKEALFFGHYAATGKKAEAVKESGLPWTHIWARTQGDPKFARQVEECRLEFADTLHDVAVERAVEGWVEDVWHNGEAVGKKRRYDHRLLEKLLMRHDPAFKDKVEHSGNMGLSGVLLIEPPSKSTEEWLEEHGGEKK